MIYGGMYLKKGEIYPLYLDKMQVQQLLKLVILTWTGMAENSKVIFTSEELMTLQWLIVTSV